MRYSVWNGAVLGRRGHRLGEPMVLTPYEAGGVLENWTQASQWASQAVTIYGSNPSNPAFAGIPALIGNYTALAESNEVQALIQSAHLAIQLQTNQQADYSWINKLGEAYSAAHQAWLKATAPAQTVEPTPSLPAETVSYIPPGEILPYQDKEKPSPDEQRRGATSAMPEWLPIAGVAVAAVAVAALLMK